MTPTVIVTPTPGIDCSFTECNNLFHALNINDTSYCYQRMGVYNCLNSTLNACPNGNILNHDVIKEELDNLPSSSCRCVRCDDVYNALVARTPTDDDYCELHKQVDECTRRIIVSCNTNEALFLACCFNIKLFRGTSRLQQHPASSVMCFTACMP